MPVILARNALGVTCQPHLQVRLRGGCVLAEDLQHNGCAALDSDCLRRGLAGGGLRLLQRMCDAREMGPTGIEVEHNVCDSVRSNKFPNGGQVALPQHGTTPQRHLLSTTHRDGICSVPRAIFLYVCTEHTTRGEV